MFLFLCFVLVAIEVIETVCINNKVANIESKLDKMESSFNKNIDKLVENIKANKVESKPAEDKPAPESKPKSKQQIEHEQKLKEAKNFERATNVRVWKQDLIRNLYNGKNSAELAKKYELQEEYIKAIINISKDPLEDSDMDKKQNIM
jgi:hypothetical protein